MSEFEEELKRIIKTQIDINIMLVTAKVKAVDDKNYTITIENNLLKQSNIPLRALNIGNDKGIIVIPKVNSAVVCYYHRHQSTDYIRLLACSEIDKVIINTEKVSITMDNNNVHINAEKVYINTDGETEPLTKGQKTKEHIDKIYDCIYDLYSQILVPHTGNMGAPTVVSPTVIANSTAKQIEITTQKSILDEIKSNKNFTE